MLICLQEARELERAADQSTAHLAGESRPEKLEETLDGSKPM